MTGNTPLSILDRPEILNFLFYPRKDSGWGVPEYAKLFEIKAQDGTRIGCRFYLCDPEKPHIVFFHGNGEIAEDYDDIGQVYTKLNLNFMVADYRGYGRSEGEPSVSSMLTDAHDVFTSIRKWMEQESRNGPVWIMGRSLGSASAIELAALYPDMITGLIVESGFSETLPLLNRLGIDTKSLGIRKDQVFSNAEKIKGVSKPTLIIHAQYDQIIPLSHGEDLFKKTSATMKKFHMVPGADHNTILMMAGMSYFDLIEGFIRHSVSD